MESPTHIITPMTPGQRIAGALIFLSLLISPPITALIGLLVSWLARQRSRPIVAYAQQAAIWQIAYCLGILVMVAFARFSLIGELLRRVAAVVNQYPIDQLTIRFPFLWQSSTTGQQAFFSLFCLLLLLNVIVVIVGVVMALLGRTCALPFLSRFLCASSQPTTDTAVQQ